MTQRLGLLIGAVITGASALIFVVAPVDWFADVLDVAADDATAFLVRRYAASATAALFVVAIGAVRGLPAPRAALLGLGTSFAVQGSVAVAGVAAGTVGGLAWLAVFADPALALGFLSLARPAGDGSGPGVPVGAAADRR